MPIKLTTYLKTYKVGDIVDIKADAAIHKGMPHKFYHGYVFLSSWRCIELYYRMQPPFGERTRTIRQYSFNTSEPGTGCVYWNTGQGTTIPKGRTVDLEVFAINWIDQRSVIRIVVQVHEDSLCHFDS